MGRKEGRKESNGMGIGRFSEMLYDTFVEI